MQCKMMFTFGRKWSASCVRCPKCMCIDECRVAAAVEGVQRGGGGVAAEPGGARGAGAVPGGVAVHRLRQGHAARRRLPRVGRLPARRRHLPLQHRARSVPLRSHTSHHQLVPSAVDSNPPWNNTFCALKSKFLLF